MTLGSKINGGRANGFGVVIPAFGCEGLTCVGDYDRVCVSSRGWVVECLLSDDQPPESFILLGGPSSAASRAPMIYRVGLLETPFVWVFRSEAFLAGGDVSLFSSIPVVLSCCSCLLV